MLSESELQQKAQAIRLLVLDVDGILTDGRLFYGASGETLKVFNTLDGHGIKMAQKNGIQVALITGRRGEALMSRAKDLGIEWIQQGREDKFDALQEMIAGKSIGLHEIACMGDDWPDLSIMCRVGLALTVPNAHDEVIARAHWQSKRRGGEGAVREACDMLMRAKGSFAAALAAYTDTGR
ncbi:phenylphosphate carboxylase subunit delta [Saccharophagus sp. K07]|mgnify:CR=1 FL=1|jgi:3-deoxy-D-manno-octulosonate 8-phosphate phosphatase (KDO 8-P phosphatase)|uniref:KdsC family phosphatase n=1 Tax=Saccharophagus sp. K07 TaxID=2283636 RepID=UPI001652A8A0|nr:HAD hydrolase family protein [Saccharophagus sp. K07]MBC6907298.1 phenylphosphate carboxylase subunit delta [Saccharophagus sp. K07]